MVKKDRHKVFNLLAPDFSIKPRSPSVCQSVSQWQQLPDSKSISLSPLGFGSVHQSVQRLPSFLPSSLLDRQQQRSQSDFDLARSYNSALGWRAVDRTDEAEVLSVDS